MTPIDDIPAHADLELAVGAEAEARSQWQLFRRRFFKHRLAVAALVVLAVISFACFFADFVAPYDIDKFDINLINVVKGPSWQHLMGTTDLGTDQFTQILYAGQISLKIGFFVAILSTVFGVSVGALAGYYGGYIDQLVSGFTDGFLVIPQLAILAVLLKYFGQSPTVIILVLAGLGWTYVARVSRGQVLSFKEKEFVEAARAAGASGPRIIVRHVLPNMVGPIMVNLTLSVAGAIISEATLTFLGYGIKPPDSSWGFMLSANEGAINDPAKMHLLLFPGLMLLIVVLCVNFLGDGLRDAFDPQAKHSL